MMRANIKQQRWDHTNSLLTTDISLERKTEIKFAFIPRKNTFLLQ